MPYAGWLQLYSHKAGTCTQGRQSLSWASPRRTASFASNENNITYWERLEFVAAMAQPPLWLHTRYTQLQSDCTITAASFSPEGETNATGLMLPQKAIYPVPITTGFSQHDNQNLSYLISKNMNKILTFSLLFYSLFFAAIEVLLTIFFISGHHLLSNVTSSPHQVLWMLTIWIKFEIPALVSPITFQAASARAQSILWLCRCLHHHHHQYMTWWHHCHSFGYIAPDLEITAHHFHWDSNSVFCHTCTQIVIAARIQPKVHFHTTIALVLTKNYYSHVHVWT